MAAATESLDALIEDIQVFLAETSQRDLFSSTDVSDHLLDFMNRATTIKDLLEN